MPNVERISPSQIGVWTACPQKWHYKYVEKLKRISIGTPAINKGVYYHELSHVYYHTLQQSNFKPGKDNEFLVGMMLSRIRNDLDNLGPLTSTANLQTIADVTPLIKRFIEFQSPRIDNNITILGIEHEYFVEVRLPSGRTIKLHGIIDLTYRDAAGRIRVRDHKTSERADAWNVRRMTFMDQLLMYAIATGEEMLQFVGDVEINFIITKKYKTVKKPDHEVYQLLRHSHTPVAIEKAKQQLFTKLDVMLDTPIYRNYTKECSSCEFFNLCEVEMRGLDVERTIQAEYRRTDKDAEHQFKLADLAREVDASEHTKDGNAKPFSVSIDI